MNWTELPPKRAPTLNRLCFHSPTEAQKPSLVNGLIQSYHQRDGDPCFTAGFFFNSWFIRAFKFKFCTGTAIVVQWLRICLPGEGGTN